MKRSYEEQLRQEGFLLKLTKGTSMEPMLREGREQSLIKSPEAMGREPQIKDVVLFRRKNGEFVLHRIVRMKGERFLIRGDNTYGSDLVDRADILGILAGFYRGETFVDCEKDPSYRGYVRRRCFWFPLRWLLFRGKCLWRAVRNQLHT